METEASPLLFPLLFRFSPGTFLTREERRRRRRSGANYCQIDTQRPPSGRKKGRRGEMSQIGGREVPGEEHSGK